MRLGGCVAIECAAALGIAIGIGLGANQVMRELDAHWERDAHATVAVAPVPASAIVAPVEPRGTIARPGRPGSALTRGASQHTWVFHGTSDDELLEPLRDGVIRRVKFNRGGSSLTFRIDFESGARAAFKPDQTNLQTVPRREVAAYRINRLLGLSSVAPAIGRELPVDELLAAVDSDSRGFIPRMELEMVTDDGFVSGELSWWIPVIQQARIGGYPIDQTDGIVTWKRYLTVGNPIPDDDRALAGQISDMLVFDFLINNMDRWSGRNAQASEDGASLYFMDNTLSFGREPNGHVKVRRYLMRSQKFSRSLIRRLRALDESTLRRALHPDRGPWEEILTDAEIEAVMARRAFVLDYVDSLAAAHGADEVLVFP